MKCQDKNCDNYYHYACVLKDFYIDGDEDEDYSVLV